MMAPLKVLAVIACVMQAQGVFAARWDLVHSGAGNELLSRALATFSADVATATRQALTIRAKAAAPAGATLHTLRSAKAAAGAITMAEIAAGDPLLGIDEIPFLAVNFVEARKLWSVLKPKLEGSLSRQGLILLFAVAHPPKALVSNRRLTRVQDFRQSSLVLDSPGLEAFARLTGARGVRTGGPAALMRSGKADLAVMSSAEAVADKAWEYTRYFYDAPAWFPKHLVVAHRDAVIGLDRSTRDGLLNAADRAEVTAWEKAESEAVERVQNLRDRGVKVREPDVNFLIELEQLGRNLLFEWSDSAGEPGAEVVESYYAIK